MAILSKKKKVMELEEVTKLLSQLKLPTAYVFTPTNLATEKKKFFNSDKYSPEFQYKVVNNNNAGIFKKLAEIEEISDVDPRLSSFYIDLIEAKKEANSLMNAVGNNEAITEISTHRFGRPTPTLFRNATRVLRGKTDSYNFATKSKSKKEDLLGFDEIKNVFDVVFEELDLMDWDVEKSQKIAKNGIKVGIKTKRILVDPKIERSKLKLRKTLVHEVGTHVLRAVNGLDTGFEAFSKPNLPKYLDVEEGLATWNEHHMGLLTENWLRKKAALVYATYIGEGMSFRELHNALLGVLPKYGSFDTVYRIKRGLGDTALPGLYTKDIVYFRGFRRVLNRLKKDPSLYGLLYAGKIDFKQCEWVREGLLPKAKIVPTKEMWEDIFKKAGI